MSPEDPGLWKEILGAAVAAVSAAVAWVWRKVDNSASKAELAEALRAVEKSTDQWRQVTKELFANAESDRLQWHEKFGKMQDTIHGVHIEVLKNCAELRQANDSNKS